MLPYFLTLYPICTSPLKPFTSKGSNILYRKVKLDSTEKYRNIYPNDFRTNIIWNWVWDGCQFQKSTFLRKAANNATFCKKSLFQLFGNSGQFDARYNRLENLFQIGNSRELLQKMQQLNLIFL